MVKRSVLPEAPSDAERLAMLKLVRTEDFEAAMDVVQLGITESIRKGYLIAKVTKAGPVLQLTKQGFDCFYGGSR